MKRIIAYGCDRLYPEYLKQLARVVRTNAALKNGISSRFSNG